MLLHNICALHPASPGKMPDGRSAFVVVDVCHSSSTQFAEDDEMPTVAERPDAAMPVFSFDYSVPVRPVFFQFLLVSQNGRPPES